MGFKSKKTFCWFKHQLTLILPSAISKSDMLLLETVPVEYYKVFVGLIALGLNSIKDAIRILKVLEGITTDYSVNIDEALRLYAKLRCY